LKKNFQVPERTPLSALAPARRAAVASELKAPPCPLTVRAHNGSTAMLVEIYLLKLEAAVRAAKEAATTTAARTSTALAVRTQQ
jgi:hypothetical protein